VKIPEVRQKLTMLVIVGTRTDAHSLRSQMGIGSESDCLLGQLDRILRILDSETGLKEEKSEGVVGEEGECGDDVVGLLESGRRRLDILSVKKEAKLSAREIPDVGLEEGKGEEDLRCKSLFAICQRRLGLSEDDETRLE